MFISNVSPHTCTIIIFVHEQYNQQFRLIGGGDIYSGTIQREIFTINIYKLPRYGQSNSDCTQVVIKYQPIQTPIYTTMIYIVLISTTEGSARLHRSNQQFLLPNLDNILQPNRAYLWCMGRRQQLVIACRSLGGLIGIFVVQTTKH